MQVSSEADSFVSEQSIVVVCERSYDCRCLFPQHPGQQHGFIPVPKQEVGEMYQYQPLVLTQLGPDVPNDECLITNKYDNFIFMFVLISVM